MNEATGDILVFVYGTLLKGEANHRLLAGARFIAEAATHAEYDLVDLGPYPAMTPGGATSVRGEVYAIDAVALERLDLLESHPDFYRRVEITLNDGSRVFTYIMDPHKVVDYPRLESGRWSGAG